jgi:HlyD family secretion protein
MRWKRIALWGGLGLVLVAVLAWLLRPQPVPVDLATVERGPLAVTVSDEGRTRVRDVFTLSTPVTGRMLRIGLEVGDPVVAGETVVAEIEPIDPGFLDVRAEAQAHAGVRAAQAAEQLAEAQLERTRAELDFARAEVNRARELVERGTIPRRALEEAERTFRAAQATLRTAEAEIEVRRSELEEARARLGAPLAARTRSDTCPCVPIYAPVGGRILQIFQKSEGVVQAGQALVEIGDPTELEIVIDLLSSDAVRVRPGNRVKIDHWGGERTLEGLVHRVEPSGFTKVSALGIEEQRVAVVIDLIAPHAQWEALGHGYRVEATIVVWETADTLKVPLSALFRDRDRWAVFAVENGRATRRHVEIGRRAAFEVQILDGLSPGDRVVVHPGDRIGDGSAVVERG